MNITCVSDLHGHLPHIETCDLLLIAGDICPVTNHKLSFQLGWVATVFNAWLSNVPAEHKVLTWGNHDLIAEDSPRITGWVPGTVLVDGLCEVEGMRIYGLPWQLRFHDWAFNLDEPELSAKYDAIPECDIIVSHGPPKGYGDRAPDGALCGSSAFVDAIDRCQPKLAVFGHIHIGNGIYQRGGTTLVNASHVNEQYQPVHEPYCLAV